MWAGRGFTSPPATDTAVLASARLVSMLSSEDTIPTRNPTTTRTTRTPMVTQVHIQPVSAPVAALRGAVAAAVAMFSSLLSAGYAEVLRATQALVDASGVVLRSLGFGQDVSGVAL